MKPATDAVRTPRADRRRDAARGGRKTFHVTSPGARPRARRGDAGRSTGRPAVGSRWSASAARSAPTSRIRAVRPWIWVPTRTPAPGRLRGRRPRRRGPHGGGSGRPQGRGARGFRIGFRRSSTGLPRTPTRSPAAALWRPIRNSSPSPNSPRRSAAW